MVYLFDNKSVVFKWEGNLKPEKMAFEKKLKSQDSNAYKLTEDLQLLIVSMTNRKVHGFEFKAKTETMYFQFQNMHTLVQVETEYVYQDS